MPSARGGGGVFVIGKACSQHSDEWDTEDSLVLLASNTAPKIFSHLLPHWCSSRGCLAPRPWMCTHSFETGRMQPPPAAAPIPLRAAPLAPCLGRAPPLRCCCPGGAPAPARPSPPQCCRPSQRYGPSRCLLGSSAMLPSFFEYSLSGGLLRSFHAQGGLSG